MPWISTKVDKSIIQVDLIHHYKLKKQKFIYLEFIAAFLDTVVIKQEKFLKEAFQKIDKVPKKKN
jgi:hypothetical protein